MSAGSIRVAGAGQGFTAATNESVYGTASHPASGRGKGLQPRPETTSGHTVKMQCTRQTRGAIFATNRLIPVRTMNKHFGRPQDGAVLDRRCARRPHRRAGRDGILGKDEQLLGTWPPMLSRSPSRLQRLTRRNAANRRAVSAAVIAQQPPTNRGAA